MQNYLVTFELEAELALADIFRHYIDTAGYEVAKNNMDILEVAINSLETMPTRCPVSDFSPNIRKLSVPKLPFLVFYTIKEHTVIILEIFHAKRKSKHFAIKIPK